MNTTTQAYEVASVDALKFDFESVGPKGTIRKRIELTILDENANYLNFGFGDLLPNGNIDDMNESNNGDIVKIFVTVINVMEKVLQTYPEKTIFFAGSTFQRTKVYHSIIQRHFPLFSIKFRIDVLKPGGEFGINEKTPYNPYGECDFVAFLITKKH